MNVLVLQNISYNVLSFPGRQTSFSSRNMNPYLPVHIRKHRGPSPLARLPCFGWQIDPTKQDTRNGLSHYTVDGQALWGQAYTYCTADPSRPIECDEGSQYLEAANETLPELLKSADGTLEIDQYRVQVNLRGSDHHISLFQGIC